MTRDTKEDLKNLVEFLQSYTLSNQVKDPSFIKSITKIHAKYLAILTFLSELSEQLETPKSKDFEYILEAASDIGQAFFCWIHGTQKACRMLLRSSIETFIKGSSCSEAPKILTEKNVSTVFTIAAKTANFSNTPNKNLLSNLRTFYTSLCSDVHTATKANMSHISSLDHFPAFSTPEATASCDAFVKITASILTLLSIMHNEKFHQMHHRNKKLILESIPGSMRKTVQNLD